MMRSPLIQAALLCVALILSPMATLETQASDRDAATSVVQIRCAMAKGQSKATGFVWPVPGQVVTALHAAVGCNEISVWSEATRKETLARVIRVNLEADLALLQLDRDLGLTALRYAPELPDTRANHFIWGYPLAAEEMTDLKIEFGGGLKRGLTTLGAAFSSKELDLLVRGQAYPSRRTQILRVNSIIQPGHSGAPIFDRNGNIVAIADGGLLGGFRTLNWSIPAQVYLPLLLESNDRMPTKPSHRAQLFSNVRSPQTAAVKINDGASTLTPVRKMNLKDLGEYMLSYGNTWAYNNMHEKVISKLKRPVDLSQYTYDIYEHNQTGATFAVPTGRKLVWLPKMQVASAASDDFTMFQLFSVKQGQSFKAVIQENLRPFLTRLYNLGTWKKDKSPFNIELKKKIVSGKDFLGGTGSYIGIEKGTKKQFIMAVSIFVSGNNFIGSASFEYTNFHHFANKAEFNRYNGYKNYDDFVLGEMMNLGRRYLTAFAVY